MSKPDWNALDRDGRVAIIKPAWDKGWSATQIAVLFENCTRNMVIGIIHRAKLQRAVLPKPTKSRVPPPKRKAAPNPNKTPKPKPIRNRNTVIADHGAPPPSDVHASKWLDQKRPPIEGTTPIGILQLPNRPGVLCRFPVVGGYCGQASGENTYCETHSAFAYNRRETNPYAGNGRRPSAGNLRRKKIDEE